MSAHVRLARRLLPYDGIPAVQVASILRADVAEIRDGRRRLGRDPEVGGPRGFAGAPSPLTHAELDALMRSNRSVGL